MPSGRYYTTDPTTGQGDTAKRPPILVKAAERAAIAHSHGDWSKGFRDEQGKQHVTGRAQMLVRMISNPVNRPGAIARQQKPLLCTRAHPLTKAGGKLRTTTSRSASVLCAIETTSQLTPTSV
jgi:hypothetical protein